MSLTPESETCPEMNPPRAQSVINRSAVKAYALKVSADRRAGKFTRVSEEFLTAVESEVEAAIRQVAIGVEPMVPRDDAREFLTGAALDKVREKLDMRIQRIIQGRVLRHPSLGCTLKD